MREGWREERLGDLCTIKSGSSNTKDAVPNGAYQFFDRSKKPKRSNQYLFDCEALVIAGEGAEFFPKKYTGKFDLHQRAYAIFGFDDQIFGDYLYYYLIYFHKYFQKVAVGATVKSLRQRHFDELPVLIPESIDEQKRIAAMLGELLQGINLAIANTNQNLANTNELFESKLNAVFTKKGDGWEDTILENVLVDQPRNGWSPPAAHHSKSGVPVLTLSAVTGFNFRVDKIKFTSASTDAQRHYWVTNGDFLITRSNTPKLVGHVAIAAGIVEPTIYPDLIMRMRPMPERVITKFLYFQLRTRSLRKEITGRASGANPTMKKIKKSDVQTLPIVLPSLDTQQNIVKNLDLTSKETEQLEAIYLRKLNCLNELKRSCLATAFLGKLTAATKTGKEVLA